MGNHDVELVISGNTPVKKQDLTALDDDPYLIELETRLYPFNIFEAIGMTTQEIRHSNFLGFLLDPRQNHGLRNYFLKRFLQDVLLNTDSAKSPITANDVDTWSFDDLIVYRERLNIDILLISQANRLAIIIENKIKSGESFGQLDRYYSQIKEQKLYFGYKVVCIYLTPEGRDPRYGDNYLPLSYGVVLELIEDLVAKHAPTLHSDVVTLLRHYAQLLRRHVVNESEIAELCQRIYHNHQKALDKIYEFRFDLQYSIKDKLEELVKADPNFVLYATSKTNTRFGLQDWEDLTQKSGKGGARSVRMLFEFYNDPRYLSLALFIGPGPQEVRERLYNAVNRRGVPFKLSDALGKGQNKIYVYPFLGEGDYESRSIEEITAKITKQWHRFITTDLPVIQATISEELRIWQSATTPESVPPTGSGD